MKEVDEYDIRSTFRVLVSEQEPDQLLLPAAAGTSTKDIERSSIMSTATCLSLDNFQELALGLGFSLSRTEMEKEVERIEKDNVSLDVDQVIEILSKYPRQDRNQEIQRTFQLLLSYGSENSVEKGYLDQEALVKAATANDLSIPPHQAQAMLDLVYNNHHHHHQDERAGSETGDRTPSERGVTLQDIRTVILTPQDP